MTLQAPLLLPRDEGQHFHFLDTLMTVKVGGDASDGALTCIELLAPRGFGPPLHRHEIEDELFFVADGEVRFTAGDTDRVAVPGTTVWLPKQLPHQFQVLSETARMCQVSTPAQFERFVADLGTPAPAPVIPEPTPVDGARVAEICAAYRIEVLGPPPAPLD
jgi:quercetin dioxygenase-like cupin family protein